jgi:hypothetical protein
MWTKDNLPLFDNAQAWTGAYMAERSDWIYENWCGAGPIAH